MSYDINELFSFEKNTYTRFGGYAIDEYLKKDDPTVTELEIPAEYNGEPVTLIWGFSRSKYIKRVVIPPSARIIESQSFFNCTSLENVEFPKRLETIGSAAFEGTNLKSAVLPKSLKKIGSDAFGFCSELECVELNSVPSIGMTAFSGCPKLPPETVVMGLVRSTDITRPLKKTDIWDIADNFPDVPDYIRPDVFELLAKNNCFRNCDSYNLWFLFKIMIIENKPELMPVAERYGMLENAELVDALINYTVESKETEWTAYFLDLKNRKFGFDGGDKFEL